MSPYKLYDATGCPLTLAKCIVFLKASDLLVWFMIGFNLQNYDEVVNPVIEVTHLTQACKSEATFLVTNSWMSAIKPMLGSTSYLSMMKFQIALLALGSADLAGYNRRGNTLFTIYQSRNKVALPSAMTQIVNHFCCRLNMSSVRFYDENDTKQYVRLSCHDFRAKTKCKLT